MTVKWQAVIGNPCSNRYSNMLNYGSP